MTDDDSDASDDSATACDTCSDPAAFWLYRPEDGRWRPLCERHAVHLHPSIELRAWLESGYAKPAELGRPDGPPVEPETGRGQAFRRLIDDVLG